MVDITKAFGCLFLGLKPKNGNVLRGKDGK